MRKVLLVVAVAAVWALLLLVKMRESDAVNDGVAVPGFFVLIALAALATVAQAVLARRGRRGE